jgi:hypothetical protein
MIGGLFTLAGLGLVYKSKPDHLSDNPPLRFTVRLALLLTLTGNIYI